MFCDDKFHRDIANHTKGALGEALVQSYFRAGGWAVSVTGIEDTVDHLWGRRDLATGQLADVPDFIVSKVSGSPSHTGTHPLGQAFYVEVKTHRTWIEDDYSHYHKWGNVLLVWVSPEGLKGTWITRPDGELTAPKVREAAFKPLEKVGIVFMKHCRTDLGCEASLRRHFDALAVTLANLEASKPRRSVISKGNLVRTLR